MWPWWLTLLYELSICSPYSFLSLCILYFHFPRLNASKSSLIFIVPSRVEKAKMVMDKSLTHAHLTQITDAQLSRFITESNYRWFPTDEEPENPFLV